MRKSLFLTIALSVLALVKTNAQEEAENIKIKVGGIVWYQYYFDTYNSVETRDGLLLLFPKPYAAGDLNKQGKLGSSAFFSRANVKFSGSEAFGAKASGMIEGDFVATHQNYVGNFRLRHAFVKLDWGKSNLIMGQFWHPIVATDVIPSSDLIANVPFFPLNRTPQICFTYNLSDELSLAGAAIVHSYHRSSGSDQMQRDAGIPEFVAKLKYKTNNLVLGLNGGIKTLKSRLLNIDTTKTDVKIATPYVGGFAKFVTKPITVKAQAIYGKNLTHFTMIGSFGVKASTAANVDYEYTALNSFTTWIDANTNGKKVQAGLFFGYAALLGASEDYISLGALGRGENLSNTWRVAPRVDFLSGKMKVGFEYVLTAATYGSAWDSKYKVTETADAVFNNRILVNIMYKF